MHAIAVSIPPLVAELAIVLLAAALISYVCGRIGLVPIVGFILAGAVVGPEALGLIDDPDLVEQTAEIGVIFLLFGIGLELSADRLRQLGSLLLGGGGIQVVLTIALVAGACIAAGVETRTAIYTGCLVSLSSTAIVLKMLSDRRETTSSVGEVSVAFLIFQDLAVVVMVLLVPLLGGEAGGLGDIVEALLTSAIVLVFVLATTQWLIPKVLDRVAEAATDEVFLLTVAAFALVVAYAASALGLTDSLGAFIAGLVVSSSRHRERALRYVMPFQTLFSAIFFASIGMLLDPAFLIERWDLVLVLSIGTVLLKAAATGTATRVFRRKWPTVVASALLLAQVGEFAFVLEQAGRAVGLTPAGAGRDGSQAFIATSVLLFVLTPLLDVAGRTLARRLAERAVARGEEDPHPPPPEIRVIGASEAGLVLMRSAIERAGAPNPVVGVPLAPDAVFDPALLRGAAVLVVADVRDEAWLDALVEAASDQQPAVHAVVFVRDDEMGARLARHGSLHVVGAGTSMDLALAHAVLQDLGVERDVRITSLTSAMEHLPRRLARP